MVNKLFKYWLVNVLVSLALFVAYRIFISKTETGDDGWFAWLLDFLDIFINLGFSLIYLAAMLINALFIFLNRYQKIRNNFYYSLFTFAGLASLFTGYWLVSVLMDDLAFRENPLRTFIVFCLIYLGFCGVQFIVFRKQSQSIQ